MPDKNGILHSFIIYPVPQNRIKHEDGSQSKN